MNFCLGDIALGWCSTFSTTKPNELWLGASNGCILLFDTRFSGRGAMQFYRVDVISRDNSPLIQQYHPSTLSSASITSLSTLKSVPPIQAIYHIGSALSSNESDQGALSDDLMVLQGGQCLLARFSTSAQNTTTQSSYAQPAPSSSGIPTTLKAYPVSVGEGQEALSGIFDMHICKSFHRTGNLQRDLGISLVLAHKAEYVTADQRRSYLQCFKLPGGVTLHDSMASNVPNRQMMCKLQAHVSRDSLFTSSFVPKSSACEISSTAAAKLLGDLPDEVSNVDSNDSTYVAVAHVEEENPSAVRFSIASRQRNFRDIET
jgi:hypothetical protein